MCGIVGEFAFDTADRTDCIPMLTAMMQRRGPDDEGYWADDPHCTFGFRRLAILDLSPTGHQPMFTPDGRYVMIFNGEMYNFKDLRHLLERDYGCVFRSTGDTEVVLHALRVWGVDAFERFNGMFALAFYDRQERTLLLARDHAGIKPLYYLRTTKGVVFASQYNQLLAHPWGRNLEVNPQALRLYVQHTYIQSPYGLHENTHLLEAGHWLKIAIDGRQQVRSYFHFPDEPYSQPLTGSDAYDAVSAAVSAAVKRQMISDVPLGTFLSGGIDSPLIAAIMARSTDQPLRAYTIGTDDPTTNELDDAQHYAAEIGLKHIYKTVTSEEALDLVLPAIAATSEPLADYSVIPTMMVSELARRNVTVMLSGDGGDELFWGYAQRFGRIVNLSAVYSQPYWLRLIQAGWHRALGSPQRSMDLRWNTIGDRYRAAHSTLPPRLLQRLLPQLYQTTQAHDLFTWQGSDPQQVGAWLRHNEFTGHLTRILMKVDHASMAHSLEVRVPLLDREVIEVASRINIATCLAPDNSLGKLPLRHALKQHISYQTQSKKGFSVPMGDWLRGPLKGLLHDQLLGQVDLLGQPLNQKLLISLVDRHVNAEADFTTILWTLLNLRLWEQHHLQPAELKVIA